MTSYKAWMRLIPALRGCAGREEARALPVFYTIEMSFAGKVFCGRLKKSFDRQKYLRESLFRRCKDIYNFETSSGRGWV